jgi:hypothetical protein
LATVSLILQAISQNSSTDEGLRIHGSLLSVIFEGGAGDRLLLMRRQAIRRDHSSLSRSIGMRYWGNATAKN